MSGIQGTVTDPAKLELVIKRVFNAPRSLVFAAWTEPEHMKQWRCTPHGFTVTHQEGDIRVGGSYKVCMRSPDGVDHWLQGVYKEIVKPERLVFTHQWLDTQGKPGLETLVTITFHERGAKTELVLHQTGFKNVQSRDGHNGGWSEALEQLAAYVEKK